MGQHHNRLHLSSNAEYGVSASFHFISSHGILLGPAAGSRLILLPVRLVHVSNLGDKRVVWVGISKQGADRKQNLKHKKKVVSGAATH